MGNMGKNDILAELDSVLKEKDNSSSCENKTILEQETILENGDFFYDGNTTKKKKLKIFSTIFFLIKYSLTCALIFGILILGTNYSAYFNIVKSYIYKEEMQEQTKSIINSVEAANLKTKVKEDIKKENSKTKEEVVENKKKQGVNIKKYKRQLDGEDIKLDIEITPFENRIVIPKIGKNIPMVDIKNKEINSANELEDIFMHELKNGVIRYPGSAIPGENGTTFVFGHSSNFPWVKGNYNDVFATLDNVIYGDEIIVYYGQKKYKYTVKEKRVISPGDISVLKRNKNKKEISIMTCWPVGTTLNRLIITGEMVK